MFGLNKKCKACEERRQKEINYHCDKLRESLWDFFPLNYRININMYDFYFRYYPDYELPIDIKQKVYSEEKFRYECQSYLNNKEGITLHHLLYANKLSEDRIAIFLDELTKYIQSTKREAKDETLDEVMEKIK